jgi:hypothetical protein
MNKYRIANIVDGGVFKSVSAIECIAVIGEDFLHFIFRQSNASFKSRFPDALLDGYELLKSPDGYTTDEITC